MAGLIVRVECPLYPSEDPAKVARALDNLFPGLEFARSDGILRAESGMSCLEELRTLKSDVAEFDAALGEASSNIESGVVSISDSVHATAEASSQLNSLLIPVVTSIGIIVALQVAILARRR